MTVSARSHCQRREVKRRAWAAAVALAAALACGGVAGAHPQYSPTSSNRYLKLTPSGDGTVRFAWSLLVGETPALAIRRAADANGDGQCTEEELAAFTGRVLGDVRQHLRVELDGAAAEVSWEAPILGLPDRRVGPLPFAIDLIGRLSLPAGPAEHRVTVDDATQVEELGESEIRIEEGPGARVLAAWQGREDGGRVLRYVWNGPKRSALEERSVGFRVATDPGQRPRPPRRPRAPVGLIAALVGGAVALFAARYRRRLRSGGRTTGG